MMKRVLCALALLCAGPACAEPPPQPMPWEAISEIYATPLQSRMFSDSAIYGGCHMGSSNYGTCAEGVWNEVDLNPFGIPDDARFVWLSGMVIVTRPDAVVGVVDIHMTFRQAGDTSDPTCQKYLVQGLSSLPGQSVRENTLVMVPVENGRIQWCWRSFYNNGGGYQSPDPSTYPNGTAYGFNFNPIMWAR